MNKTESDTDTKTIAGNNLFPVFLKLERLNVLLIGGGKVAHEKTSALLANSPGVHLTIVAAEFSENLLTLCKDKSNIIILEKYFEEKDLENQDLVISAVNDPETSEYIQLLSKSKGLLINVADKPELCDFYLGSIVQKGHVKIAISTNGKSPTLAKRIRETFEESFPENINESIDNLNEIRNYLQGDFSNKVNTLNEITSVLKNNKGKKNRRISKTRIWVYTFAAPALLIAGYTLSLFLPPETIGGLSLRIANNIDSDILIYMSIGFLAQIIDGAIGMAYGLTSSTLLLSAGVSPAASSASVHASEIFTSGVSGWMHLKFGNVNTKLFRKLLIPGVLGASIGAFLLSSLESYNHIVKPLVSIYLIVLGAIIIYKALRKNNSKEKIKHISPLGFIGGLLDSIGGGGWGPIVSSSLIAGGRNAKYVIGSANLTEFFVALASSVTFFTMIGLNHWSIIAGLIIGGSIAAPIGAYLTHRIPHKSIMIIVGIVTILISLKRIFF